MKDKGNFVAYYRVSTGKQAASGLGLEAQKQAVANYLNGGNWTLIAEFLEVETGKRADRPELGKALEECEMTGATLVIAKLDRLARNVHFLSGLMESGVNFVACDMPQANRMTIHILAAVAEGEAAAISQRTKVALAAAKARGVKLGGNRGNLTDEIRRTAVQHSVEKRQCRAAEYKAKLLPLVEKIYNGGELTLQQVADELNRRNRRTPRGGQWKPMQVHRILQAAR
jgi:DNA invertase Pin-like site-specific DNA recombinase